MLHSSAQLSLQGASFCAWHGRLSRETACDQDGCSQLQVHLIEVSGGHVPGLAGEGHIVGVVHLAQVVEASSLHRHRHCQEISNALMSELSWLGKV